jgi:CARDB
MGKLMGSKGRSLFLCALLLALPSLAAAQCPSQLTVQSILTQDTNGTNKTTFAPGEPIRFVAQLNNAYGGILLGSQITITTSFFSNSIQVNIPSGMSTWPWNTTVPSQQANYTVTVSAFDSFCGFSVSASASFTVGQGTGSLPDLSATKIEFDSADLVIGRTVFFDSGVQNTGGQGTGVFNVRWFVDGESVGFGSHEGVPANSTILNGNSQFSWVATEGAHTITFAVDVDNQVMESDESNNSTSVKVTVTPASGQEVSSTPGTIRSIGFSVCQQGTHELVTPGSVRVTYDLISDTVDLSQYEGMLVRVIGTVREGVDGCPPLLAVREVNPSDRTVESSNGIFAGYVAGGQTQRMEYTKVTGTWNVPGVVNFCVTESLEGTASQSATWVGLADDSINPTSLVQAGTVSGCTKVGSIEAYEPTYAVAWQVFIQGQSSGTHIIFFTEFLILPGNEVKVEVTSFGEGFYHIDITNQSLFGLHWEQIVLGDYPPEATAVAECLEEHPPGFVLLTHFSSVTITCTANDLPIGSAGDIVLKVVSPKMSTGDLNADGEGDTFTIDWVKSN